MRRAGEERGGEGDVRLWSFEGELLRNGVGQKRREKWKKKKKKKMREIERREEWERRG